MCEPTTLAVLTIASTAATVYQQDQAARAQTKANQQTYDSQMLAYNYNLANANVTKQQEAENLAQKKLEINSRVQADQAKATVSAGEAGVSGLSVDALLQELGGAGGRAVSNAETNYLRRDRAIEAEKMNMWSGTASAINSLKTPQGPDYLGAALKIGTAAYDYNNPRASDVRVTRGNT
jgi:hypothetical protein